MTNLDLDLDELDRLAKAATPGTPTQAFSAAASPQTVMALIDRVRTMEGVCKRLGEALKEAQDHELSLELRLSELESR